MARKVLPVIVDRHPVFLVDRVMVRCNECVRQVSVYVGTGMGGQLGDQLDQLGWFEIGEAHYCPEHVS